MVSIKPRKLNNPLIVILFSLIMEPSLNSIREPAIWFSYPHHIPRKTLFSIDALYQVLLHSTFSCTIDIDILLAYASRKKDMEAVEWPTFQFPIFLRFLLREEVLSLLPICFYHPNSCSRKLFSRYRFRRLSLLLLLHGIHEGTRFLK